MTIEEKKEYLRRYKEAIGKCSDISIEMDRLYEDLVYPSVKLDGMPHSGNASDLSDGMVEIDTLMQKMSHEKDRAVAVRDEIADCIGRVDEPNEQRVLHLRYLTLLKWSDIAIQMGCVLRNVHLIHRRALEHLEI
jgi:DNA-directed RNA polymerase specialized sigma24 family protein